MIFHCPVGLVAARPTLPAGWGSPDVARIGALPTGLMPNIAVA